MTIELITDIIDRTPMFVISIVSHRENLIVALYRQFKLCFKVFFDELECFTQDLFAVRERRYVIGIFGRLQHRLLFQVQTFTDEVSQTLVDPVHEIAQIEVGKILTKVITYRQTFRAVNDFIQKPQEVSVLYLAANEPLHNSVTD